MKQTITIQQELALRHYMRLYGLILAFMLAGIIGLQAQTASWTTGYPKLSPTVLSAMDDPGYVDVYFTPTVAAIATAKLEVKLPANYTYVSTENGTGHTSTVTYPTPVVTGTVAAGQTITVSFNSNGNTLKIGEPVFLRFKITAGCAAVNGATATVKVMSNATVITTGQQNVTYGVTVPVIRVTCDSPTQNYPDQITPKYYELKLDNQNGQAGSLKLTLRGDKYTTLGDLTLDGTSITPTSVNVVSGNYSTTVITLTSTEMGGKLGTTVKKLKFSATNTRCGSHQITTSAQYPSTSNCTTQSGVTLTMAYDEIPGTPSMTLVSAGWVAENTKTTATVSAYDVCMDGVTPTWYRVVYKNGGSAAAATIRHRMQAYRDIAFSYSYYDIDNIYYSVDGGTTIKKVNASDITVLATLPDNNNRVLKSGVAGKPGRIELNIEDNLAAGQQVIFFYPVVNGNIYDNTNNPNSIFNASTLSEINFHAYEIFAWNACNVEGGRPVNTTAAGSLMSPRIPGASAPVSVRPGQSGQVAFDFFTGILNPTNNVTLDAYVQLPSWLELDGSLATALQFETNTGIATAQGGNIYSVRLNISTTGEVDKLILKYKGTSTCPAPAGENKTDQIRFWINWNMGAVDAGCDKTLGYYAQQYVPAILLCKEDGIVMDGFSQIRLTRGLKDSNNNGIPDDGTEAPESDINHSYYLRNDQGKFVYNLRVAGTPITTYNYLYALLSSPSLNFKTELTLDAAEFKVNGTVISTAAFTEVNANQFYFNYTNTSTPLKGGDLITITLPFTTKTSNDLSKPITAEAYVCNTVQTNAFSPTERRGEDKMYSAMAIYQESLPNTSGSNTFVDNSIVNTYLHYYASYAYLNFSPWFKNEIRRAVQPNTIEFPLPAGYLIPDNQLRVTVTYKMDNIGPATQTLTAVSKTETDAGITYLFDLTQLYDLSFIGEDLSTPDPTKWIMPDDKFYYEFRANIQATKGAAATSTWYPLVKSNLISTGTIATTSVTKNFAYTGTSVTLSASTNTVAAYGPTLSIPALTVGNPGNTAINETWLYVVGNVSDIKLKNISTGAVVANGEGDGGRWIKVAPSIAANGSLGYTFEFNYLGSSSCDASSITIYTVSAFNTAWTPTTSAPLDLTDVDHIGARRMISITSAPATISGSIATSTSTLVFNTPYTLTAVLDSRNGEGSIKDAQIEITIPAGQQYTPSSAKIEYPKGTTPVFAYIAYPTLEADLIAANADLTTARTVYFKSSKLLPGFKADNTTDDDRQMTLTATYVPVCGTPLTGINYTGKLTGTTSCGEAIKGNNSNVFSTMMYSNVSSNYAFEVTTAMKSGNKAFNEQRTTDVLQVTIKKISGIGINMLATDSLILRLPKAFDINGTIGIPSGFASGSSITIGTDTTSTSERFINLSLPITVFNSDASKGMNQPVTFEIPLTYTPNGQTLAATPVNSIHATVVTNGKFDASCDDALLSIGNASMDIAILTSTANPAKACLKSPATLDITSNNFEGSWYKDFVRTIPALATASTYTYTPTVQQDTAFYVSAIFSGVDYGTAPVKVQMNPQVSVTVSNPASICLGSSVDLKLAVTGSTNSTDTVYLASDKSTVISNPLITPTAVGAATYYILTKNTTTSCVSDTMTVTFNVNTKPAVAPITLPAAICEGSALTLPTLTVTAQGTPVTAQVWKLAGTAYTAGTLLTYADNGKSLTFTASSACGDSIVTVGNITVNAKPTVAPITLPAAICEGSALTLPTPTVAARGTAITAQTWKLNNVAYTAGTLLTYTDNGKSLTFTASSACGDSIVTVGNITVNAKPTVAPITLPAAICEGSALTLPTPTVAARGTAITAQTWKLAGTAYTAGTTLTYADNGKSLTFTASSACGDSIVTVGNIIVNAKPTVAPITLPAAICEGSALTLPTPTVAARGTAITAQTWKLNNVAYTAGTLLTYADNGKSLTFTASSACGDSIVTVGNITVNAKPTVAPITLPAAICEGSALTLPTPTVAARGTAITAQTWKLAGTAYTAGTLLTYADNGKSLTFTASSACGDSIVTVGNITVNAKPTVAPITLPAAICAGNALALPTPTVAARGTAITAQTWKLNGVAYTPGTNLAYTDNGKSLTFTASSACGDSVVTVGNITVYQTTAINTQPSVPAGIKLSNGYIIPGSIVPLSVAAVGHNLTYQWYWKKASDGSTVTLSDNSKYTGSTTASLTINNAYETENGDYYVTVTGTCNTVTSTPVTIVAVANQDASLKDLKVNGTTLSDFNPGKTDYLLAISCDDEQVTILGTPNFAGVTSITGNGTFALQPGDNYFPITIVAQDMVTTRTYTVNVVRNCYVPKIKKDLDDAVICLNGTHTWTIEAEGENLTYEWYKGEKRIMGQNSPSITFTDAKFSDYDRYYVVVRSNHNGFKSSIQSKKVRLWVADYLPEHLRLAEYPNPATVGKNYHLKVDGYVDVTKYSWSYSKSGVTFSPAVTLYNENETWATFGSLSVGTGTLKVTMEHPCGTRELTQTITVNYPTGVDDVTATVVTVYPNPTSGILKVSGTVSNQMIRVTDVTGSLKGSYKTQEGTTTIDLTGYAKGTYLVQYNGKAYKVIRK